MITFGRHGTISIENKWAEYMSRYHFGIVYKDANAP